MEAIVLAGGLGTRLRSEVSEIPKSMAPIRNRPFLEYLLDWLIANGVTRLIFSVGYKSKHIQKHFGEKYNGCHISYAIEKERLGTGGAILNAMKHTSESNVAVVNGDSLFLTDLKDMFDQHVSDEADVTLGLKPMFDFDRYGIVDINDKGRITRFREKQFVQSGLINAGCYIFNVKTFMAENLPTIFSIEKDFFEKKVDSLKMISFESNAYFLDIGIPEDFRKAQYEIGCFLSVDTSWTLFLDRDGVLNKKRDNDYVKSLDEFEWLPGVREAVTYLSRVFGRCLIVTNQQGIGKGLMTEGALEEIHAHIGDEITDQGGKVDAIYFAPKLVSDPTNIRKPHTGMAMQAKTEFPEIDFNKSIMVGDSDSDIEFAKRAGMVAVKIEPSGNTSKTYYSISSLDAFCDLIKTIVQ